MIFLTLNDVKSYLKVPFIDESQADYTAAIDSIEKDNIALIKSKIGLHFNTTAIFSTTGDNRSRLIIKVLTILVIYDLVRRNAARKVPDDFHKDFDWAMKWLDAVRDGKESPRELPIIDPETGDSFSEVRYGNNKNEENYI